LGILWSRQRTPSHRSAILTELPDEVVENPTATHHDADGHATAFRKAGSRSAEAAVGSTRQRRPFHRSASVVSVPEAPAVAPTAVQAERALHATPSRTLALARPSFGVGWIRHLVPFQRSAKVPSTLEDVS
jgi:hypothetical protein